MNEWDHLTPRELMLLVLANDERNRDQGRAKRVETYNLAGAIRAMVLSKHAPSFERMFPRDAKKEPMSDEQMYRQVQELNRMMGGTEE